MSFLSLAGHDGFELAPGAIAKRNIVLTHGISCVSSRAALIICT